MIKNIIFDFDGVLVDSEILVAKAFSKYMQELGIKTNEKEFANLAGKKTVEVIDILSEKYSSYEMGKGLGPTNDMSFIKTLIICGNSSILYFLKKFPNEVTLSPFIVLNLKILKWLFL